MTERTTSYLRLDPEKAPPCIVCGRGAPENSTPPETSASSRSAYGSRYDDSLLAEQRLRILVCDDCLAQNQDRVHLLRTKKIVRTTARPWSPEYYALPGEDDDEVPSP